MSLFYFIKKKKKEAFKSRNNRKMATCKRELRVLLSRFDSAKITDTQNTRQLRSRSISISSEAAETSCVLGRRRQGGRRGSCSSRASTAPKKSGKAGLVTLLEDEDSVTEVLDIEKYRTGLQGLSETELVEPHSANQDSHQ